MAAGGPGGETMERFIVEAQKSTNQLKAVLAKLLPAAGGGHDGAETSSRDVDALLSDITDSLSQALACLRLGALDTQQPPGRSSTAAAAGGGGSSRSRQRVRTDGASRMIVLQNGAQDSYRWRKYGQKDILGARFPWSYFKCGHNSSCPAKKHVQKSDADPSKLEVTYFEAHTCSEDPPPPSSSSHTVPDAVIISATQGSTARLVPTVAMVPSDQHCIGGQPPPLLYLVPDPMTAGSNVLRTAGDFQPAVAVVPEWPVSRTKYDPVPDNTPFTPSMEEEQAELLVIPSPACSQSELLPTEVAKVELHGTPMWMEHDVAHGDDRSAISDFAVPEW